MKKIYKCLCIILALSLCFSSTAYAAENDSVRSSKFFISSSVWLTRISDNQFRACFDVTCFGIMDEVGARTIRIQKSSDGVNWTTIITYSKDTSTYLIDYNTAGHGTCVTYIGTPGCYYRAVVVLYAKNSSGIGEMTEYSSMLLL